MALAKNNPWRADMPLNNETKPSERNLPLIDSCKLDWRGELIWKSSKKLPMVNDASFNKKIKLILQVILLVYLKTCVFNCVDGKGDCCF